MSNSKVDLFYKEQKGRCFITNRAVSQGEILFVWKPYIIAPYVTETDYVCAHCLRISSRQRQEKNSILCRQNCNYVSYCSNMCEHQHWIKFHQYECSFLAEIYALKDLNFSDDMINCGRLVMRMLTQRLHELKGDTNGFSIDDICIGRSHFDNFTPERSIEFRILSQVLSKYVLTKLICQLSTDDKDYPSIIQSFLPDTEDARRVTIDGFDQWLGEMANSYSSLNTLAMAETTKYFLHRVYVLICIEEINALFHISFELEGYSKPPRTYAMGMYPSAAFVNHSCSPNLARYPVQENTDTLVIGDVVYFATRSLEIGDEVCYSYLEREYEIFQRSDLSADAIRENQERRKKRLKDEFFFDCDCKRCLNESKGTRDPSYLTLIGQLKCTQPQCKGWYIPLFQNGMNCEACKTKRSNNV